MSLCHGGPPAGPNLRIVRIAIAIGALTAAPDLATAQPSDRLPAIGPTPSIYGPGETDGPRVTSEPGVSATTGPGVTVGRSGSDGRSGAEGPRVSREPAAGGGGPIRLPQTGRVGAVAGFDEATGPDEPADQDFGNPDGPTPARAEAGRSPGGSRPEGSRAAAGRTAAGIAGGSRAFPSIGGNSGGEVEGAAAGEMIAFSHVTPAGTQRITLIHTRKSWITVYDVGPSGSVRLMSSRPIDADFSLELNATSPLPAEIRRMSGASR